jgi:sporulation protein YlmC with PRC-barrel domain
VRDERKGLEMKKQVVTVALAGMLAFPAAAAFGQQSPPAADQSAQAGLTIASDSLLGTRVRDRDGRDIGTVSKLMIDARQGKITSAIIKHGATLGMGGKELSVPWEALQLQRAPDQQLVVTMQQQFLEQAPPSQAERSKQEQPQPSASPGPAPQNQPNQQQPQPQKQ